MAPCLKRQGLTKYWDKLSREDPTTKKPYGEDMMSKILKKIDLYKHQDDQRKEDISELSPFQKISQKYAGTHSKEEIIDLYIA